METGPWVGGDPGRVTEACEKREWRPGNMRGVLAAGWGLRQPPALQSIPRPPVYLRPFVSSLSTVSAAFVSAGCRLPVLGALKTVV